MANRIRAIVVVNHRLDPHETELRIHVELDEINAGTQIKGRLMGPRSAYTSTVEIAYPFRLLDQTLPRSGTATAVEPPPHLDLRVVIPEASWWEPKTPFLYQGPLELWQAGERCEQQQLSHGIRDVRLTASGLKLNGRPFLLRGKAVDLTIRETELSVLREQGFNALLLTLDTDAAGSHIPALRMLADRYGFFILHRTSADLDTAQFDLLPLATDFVLWPEERLTATSELDSFKIVLLRQIRNPLPTRSDIIGHIEVN